MRKVTSDFYFKEAKRLGFVARSAFKLQELQKAHSVIRRGGSVLDLGCSPGAWLQAACVALGPPNAGGFVLGIDLKETLVPAQYCDSRVRAMQGDVTDTAAADLLAMHPSGFHTVLSDMAPDTAGAGRLDAIRSLSLAQAALALAVGAAVDGEEQHHGGDTHGVLLPGGHFVVKILEGAGTREWGKECVVHFQRVVWVRPKSTRVESKEVYLVGLHRKQR